MVKENHKEKKAMKSGRCAASAIMEYFDNPSMACEDYRQSAENLKSYMQRQRIYKFV